MRLTLFGKRAKNILFQRLQNLTNNVCQGGVLFPQLLNVYIDGLSDILNKSTIGGSLVASVRYKSTITCR